MCLGNVSIPVDGKRTCGQLIDGKLLSKKDLLARLREHKKKLESELKKVDKNLDKRLSPRKEVTDNARHSREKRNRRKS